MEFNDEKFQLIRYGPDHEIINQTNYKTKSQNSISQANVVKDLGVSMSDDLSFTNHIKP